MACASSPSFGGAFTCFLLTYLFLAGLPPSASQSIDEEDESGAPTAAAECERYRMASSMHPTGALTRPGWLEVLVRLAVRRSTLRADASKGGRIAGGDAGAETAAASAARQQRP